MRAVVVVVVVVEIFVSNPSGHYPCGPTSYVGEGGEDGGWHKA
jgi:hypothetical protein